MIRDNLFFVGLFPFVFGHFGLKVDKVEQKINFQAKMVRLCTKILNFETKYFK